jgi:hypothetical protein
MVADYIFAAAKCFLMKYMADHRNCSAALQIKVGAFRNSERKSEQEFAWRSIARAKPG